MKIKEEFWIPITKGIKTIELRKIDKLQNLFDEYPVENGRLKISMFLDKKEYSPNSHFVGCIYINGYQIIKKDEFFDWIVKIDDFIYDWIEYDHSIEDINTGLLQQEFFYIPRCIIENQEWLIKNQEWLTEYFKDQEEILVLQIESWEGNNLKDEVLAKMLNMIASGDFDE